MSKVKRLLFVPKKNAYGQIRVINLGSASRDVFFSLMQSDFLPGEQSAFAYFRLLPPQKKIQLLKQMFIENSKVISDELTLSALSRALLADLAQELYYALQVNKKKIQLSELPIINDFMRQIRDIKQDIFNQRPHYKTFFANLIIDLFLLYRANEGKQGWGKALLNLIVVDENKSNIGQELKSYLGSLFDSTVFFDFGGRHDIAAEDYINEVVAQKIKDQKVDWMGHILDVIFPVQGSSLLFSLELTGEGKAPKQVLEPVMLQSAQDSQNRWEQNLREATAIQSLLAQVVEHEHLLESVKENGHVDLEALRKANQLLFECLTSGK